MKNRETKSHDDGFTLVEMVVSFVLLLMLVSLSVVGILAYQDFADFKRLRSSLYSSEFTLNSTLRVLSTKFPFSSKSVLKYTASQLTISAFSKSGITE